MKTSPTIVVSVAILLCCASGARAAVYKVGPGGTDATISAALDAAIAAGGTNEIRVAAGAYAEHIAPPLSLNAFAITVTGGWNAGFSARVTDPAATVIDGSGTGQCLRVDLRDQALTLEGLTFTRGVGQSEGAVTILADGASSVEVRRCRFTGNTVQRATAAGGGMVGAASGTASLAVRDCEFTGNVLEGGSGGATAAGLWLSGGSGATVEVAGNVIADNRASASGNQVTSVGLHLYVSESATAKVHDNVIARNLSAGPANVGVIAGGATLWAAGSAAIEARRNAFLGNGTSSVVSQAQASVVANDQASAIFSDSLVAGAAEVSKRGISASSRDTTTIRVTNCTVYGHSDTGIQADIQSGTVTIANSIVTGNSPDTNLEAGVQVTSSSIGGDPKFVDPAQWDFRLRNGSPAVGAGSNAPPGGLGVTDLAGGPRVVGGPVDQGAYEFSEITTRFPVVTHAAGFGGTPWRTALFAANPTAADTSVLHNYYGGGPVRSGGMSVLAGSGAFFPDAVVFPVGLPDGESNSGSLEMVATAGGVALASRTFADPGGGQGTYGQFLGAVGDDEMLAAGETAVIPLVRSDTGFYANLGMVDGSGAGCSAEVRLFGASGAQVGSTLGMTAAANGWTQLNDVFALAAAGSRSTAYATVKVTTAGGRAWFYASVIDRLTKDPTTVPMQLAVPAGTVLRLPAAAHIAGIGGTPWRTTLGVVNAGSGAATVTLVYRSGATAVTRTAAIAAGAVQSWDDLLVDLFGIGEAASTAGAVELWADQPLAVAGRSYADKGAAGTYGQALPALAVWRDGIGSLVPGVLASVRKDASFYTNVGFVNLGAADCQVRVTLHSAGAAIGSAVTRTVPAGQWVQVNDVFAEAGAGGAESAHAVVEVLTPGGRVWAYASVIDVVSRDPTTIPLSRPWVIGPDLT